LKQVDRWAEPAWNELLRRPPVGVLIVSAILAILGAGSVLGSAFMAVTHPQLGWLPLLTGLVGGALILYVAAHLLWLTHWAWLALVLLVGLLIASSLWRLAISPPPPFASLAELVVELAVLGYFLRRDVRGAFVRR
jgi:hypothetical protein